jgi:hypothetical protein
VTHPTADGSDGADFVWSIDYVRDFPHNKDD